MEVSLFSDRIEIWNPGELPPPLTMERLRVPHPSIPRNPLMADPLFLARYIEKAGTGTLDMIALFQEAGLPEPEFRQDGGMFVQTLWRDWLTAEVLDGLDLIPRQRKALAAIRTERRLTNARYQALTGASRPAKRDLEELVSKGALSTTGAGRGAAYVAATKRLIIGSNGSAAPTHGNGSEMAQTGQAPIREQEAKGTRKRAVKPATKKLRKK